MAKNSTGQTGSGAPQSRKPVTIDLSAEEVARKAAEEAAAPAGAPAASAKPADEKVAGPAGEAPSPNAKTRDEKSDQPAAKAEAAAKRDERGKSEPLTPSAVASKPHAETHASASASSGGAPSFVSLLVAALAGGVVVAVVVAALAFAGFFRPAVKEAPDFTGDIATLKKDVDSLKAKAAENDMAPLRDQVVALQQSVGALENAPPVSAPDDAALREMRDRLAQIEERISQPAPVAPSGGVPAPDLSGVESALDELRQKLAALSAKVDNAPDEARIQSIETGLAKVGGEMDTAQALAPAVAADALAAAIDAGRPFASELAALRSLGVDADKLATLQPQAETGLPTLAAIRTRFETEVEGLDLTPPVPEGTGAIDRLMQSARGLVTVRPAHPTEGADPSAVMTRVRGALADGDLKTALAEWKALPDGVKAKTADWAKLTEARLAADDLVAELRASALSRLGSDG